MLYIEMHDWKKYLLLVTAPRKEGIKSGRMDNSGKTSYLPLVRTE